MSRISRGAFLRRAAVGGAVLGWSAGSGWVTAAEAAHCSFDDVPPLDGVLLHDDVSTSLAADDYGHIVHRTPCAVLRPGSVEDVATIVRFAAERGIKVSMRGQGSSTYGQSQVEDGVVIDSATLATVEIRGDRAVVGPGVLWRTLILASAAHGLTPPVLTDYQDLTVGGTLSLGGIQAGPMPDGAQVDNVLELDVVTGRGDLVTCSDSQHAELFNAVLAGLGQCAVIVSATIRLVPAPTTVAYVSLRYPTGSATFEAMRKTALQAFIEDQTMLAREKRFVSLGGRVEWDALTRRWTYVLDAAAYYATPTLPDRAALLAGLQGEASPASVTTLPYGAWPFRTDPQIARRKADGTWFKPHVWFLGFIGASKAHEFLEPVFATLTDADVGGGAVLLGISGHEHTRRPLFKVPREPIAFGLLLSRQAESSDQVCSFLDKNRDLYDRLVSMGGKRYPTDAIPNMTRSDWVHHYGASWGSLSAAKAKYDPAAILGSGVGIF